MYRETNYLSHFGIKGQKWGVRRYQNYDGTYTAAGKKRLKGESENSLKTGASYEHMLTKYTSPTREIVKEFSKQLAIRTAAAFIPGLAVIYNAKLTSDAVKSHDHKDYMKKEGEYEKISDLKKKTRDTDVYDDLKNANPRLGKQKGKINNCTFCTVAMEMRARGYDVRARSKAQGAVPEELYANMFEGFKMEYPSVGIVQGESRKDLVNRSYDNLCKQIEKYGDGSRGYVGIDYEIGNCGHAMYWKVSNGRVRFYDGQSGKTNPDKLFALANPLRYSYARLDNLTLKEGVTEAVVSKK